MVCRVALAPEALDDLDAARRWYRRGGPTAKERLQRIFDAVHELAEAPWRWPRDDRDPRCRMRIVGGHRIRFIVYDDARTVFVLRVRGPWQDLV